jgi:hypothetical protein
MNADAAEFVPSTSVSNKNDDIDDDKSQYGARCSLLMSGLIDAGKSTIVD